VREGLFCEIYFHDLTELAREYWDLYSNKIQKAFSVGFIPIEGERRNVEGKWIFVHTKVELIEVSCVAVPSNRQALSRSAERKRGFIAAKKERERQERDAQVFHEMCAGVGEYGDTDKYTWLYNLTEEELKELAEYERRVASMSEAEIEAYLESDGPLIGEAHDRGGSGDFVEAGYRSGDDNRFADLFL